MFFPPGELSRSLATYSRSILRWAINSPRTYAAPRPLPLCSPVNNRNGRFGMSGYATLPLIPCVPALVHLFPREPHHLLHPESLLLLSYRMLSVHAVITSPIHLLTSLTTDTLLLSEVPHRSHHPLSVSFSAVIQKQGLALTYYSNFEEADRSRKKPRQESTTETLSPLHLRSGRGTLHF